MVARVLDTVLRGGKAVLPDGATVEADIGIAGGRIEAIAAPGALAGEATADLKGLVVMPGVVDAHIHLGHGSDISRPRAASDAETEFGCGRGWRGDHISLLRHLGKAV